MNRLLSLRAFNFGGFIVCSLAMAYAYYSQYVLELDPCPLCIFQRFSMIALGILFLIAGIHGAAARSKAAISYCVLISIAALSGIAVATRHVWITMLPADKVPECGAGLEFIVEMDGWWQGFQYAFQGTGDCAAVDWTFLGMSMPMCVLLVFVSLLAKNLFWNIRKPS
jgi:disulfide bond formation protein DsbB